LNLLEIKVLILIVTAVAALFVASPALQRVLVYPQTEFFSELWLLGPGHMAEGFLYNIANGQSYKMYLGIRNQLGECAYYQIQVKFRNFTESAPDSFNRTASSLPPLYSIYVFVANNESWELPVTFGFDYSYDGESSRVLFNNLLFNNERLGLAGLSASWDSNRTAYYGNLIFELWIYNSTISGFQYHERYVDLKFNMTV
jgi:uncharacterized membrane protein